MPSFDARWSMIPALFTRTSTLPKVSTAVSTASSTPRGSLRSPITAGDTPGVLDRLDDVPRPGALELT
ncbi:hypothetical protein BX281_9791 [Streptomyces sp. Ag82_O1-15]|jgi:hypothetical protein|nr:hypothetical protein BX281_9791 [Streptomyces sp. Ag82_O1-15]